MITHCTDRDVPDETPSCIRKSIRQFNRRAACDTGATVTRYTFQESVIYVFSPGNCGADQSAQVVDAACDNVCTLGGFTGNIVCNGDTLYREVTNEEVIWRN